MDDITYDDDMENNRRLATIEESISRTLLYDVEKKPISLKNICTNVIYVLAGSTIIIIVIVVLIIVLRNMKN
jgi:hypothetical protein